VVDHPPEVVAFVVRQWTAVITRLRHGDRERAEVRFLNGTAKAITLDEISLYVGEKENPNNQKKVASVEVDLPDLSTLVSDCMKHGPTVEFEKTP
jgi:hypothetical protein